MSEQDLGADQPLPPFPPEGVTLPDGQPLPPSGGEVQLASSDAIQNVGPFWFCFQAAGRDWGQTAFYAPSPQDAQQTAAQVAGLLQEALRRMGFPGVVVTYYEGVCAVPVRS
jgi:hypothetical protein